MKWLRVHPWVGPLLALFVVYLLFVALAPETFARVDNLTTMARQTVVVGIAAAGMTLIILQGGIDLSVGSSVALSTVVVALALRAGAPGLVAVAAGVGACSLAGFSNGALVTGLGISPFIVTLGTMSALRGLAKGLAAEQKIDAPARWLDGLLAPLSPGMRWAVFPPGVWVMLVCAVVVAATVRYTRFGRHVVAIGSNEATARLCGVPITRTKLLVYGAAGALAGLAGVMEFSTLTVGDPTDSIGLELEVIAAVVIGGGSLSGGEGSVAGSLIGAALMTVIRTGCTHLGIDNWVQEIVTGAIIVAAVAVDRLRSRER